MTAEIAIRESNVTELATARPPGGGLALSFQDMVQRVAMVDQFYREVMQEGTDYGKIPGVDKDCLFQPGAQMLDQVFGYSPRFEITPSSVIDWSRPIPFFHYIIRCSLISLRTGETVAEGIGSCNSYEDKYRWRNAKRVCPDCKAEAIIKGKQEYGGGWLCFKKNGGCGAKFFETDVTIIEQVVGRVENEDTASLENTISKMAQKRAHIAATLNATGASRIFTQDIEDLPQFQNALVVESSSRPSPRPDTPPAASAEDRAKFEASWKRGVARAIACGVAPDDAPPPTATAPELKRATFDLLDQIKAREDLNVRLIEVRTEAKEHQPDLAEIDPAQMTDAEVHEQIATCERILDAAEQADDQDEAF